MNTTNNPEVTMQQASGVALIPNATSEQIKAYWRGYGEVKAAYLTARGSEEKPLADAGERGFWDAVEHLRMVSK